MVYTAVIKNTINLSYKEGRFILGAFIYKPRRKKEQGFIFKIFWYALFAGMRFYNEKITVGGCVWSKNCIMHGL